MTALPADLDFVADPTASPARMNRAMTNLNGRTAALETYKPNFDAALATIQQVGLDRLSQVLIPIYEQLVSVAQLGALFRAHSSSTLAVAAGPQTLVVDPAQASQFAAAATTERQARWSSMSSKAKGRELSPHGRSRPGRRRSFRPEPTTATSITPVSRR